MQRPGSHLGMETVAAESPKFVAPLVFIHGLWCTAAVWRRFMGFFAHRGWTSHALTLRGPDSGAAGPLGFADHLRDVRALLARDATRPIVIGHDAGGLLALALAPAARAVIALAPLVPVAFASARHPVLSSWRMRLAMARRHPLPPPRGRLAAACFGAAPPGGVRPESSGIARELARTPVPVSELAATPALVIAGSDDRIVPVADVDRFTRAIGATFRCVNGATHAMPWEPGWEKQVSDIHRWLVQSLGERLLLPREDEE